MLPSRSVKVSIVIARELRAEGLKLIPCLLMLLMNRPGEIYYTVAPKFSLGRLLDCCLHFSSV
jgi:hypothetical protein